MKNLTYILLIALCVSCKKENGPEANIDFKKIYGQWELYSRSGGLAYTHYVNTSGQHVLALEINTDNTFRFFNNGQASASESFTIAKGSWLYGADYYDIKPTNPGINQAIFKAKSDTLELSDEANDGYSSVYIRYRGK